MGQLSIVKEVFAFTAMGSIPVGNSDFFRFVPRSRHVEYSIFSYEYSLLLPLNSLCNDFNAFLASCELPLTDERSALLMEAIVPVNRDEIY